MQSEQFETLKFNTLEPIQRIDPGHGRIAVQNEFSRGHVFSELSSTYPLKLLSPKVAQDRLAIVYFLTYGGGLVGGDSISLSIDVGPGSSLVLLSQGSTKIFKDRQLALRPSARPSPSKIAAPVDNAGRAATTTTTTTQALDARIACGATLFVLVDPVTCFANASYEQTQTFRLERGASLFMLDSLTAGRVSLGEEWAFRRYFSLNEVRVGGGESGDMCVARDVMLLEEGSDPETCRFPLGPRPLADKMAPYSCYAMVILYGPAMQGALAAVAEEYGKISVFRQQSRPELVWSFSRIREGRGGVVRVAGVDTEGVRNWLRDIFRTFEDVLGIDTYRKAFP